jgi:Met-zincin/Domain of unknown function (DUF5117)/Domain of unknown function (DUF5118)
LLLLAFLRNVFMPSTPLYCSLVALFAITGCTTIAPVATPVTVPSVEPKTIAKVTGATANGLAPTAAVPASSPAATGAPPTAPPAPAASTAPTRPFNDLIKDAKVTKGWFTTYQKDDKVWLEVLPEQFNQTFAMSMNITHGIGEKNLYGNLMGGYGAAGRGTRMIKFLKLNPGTVQVMAINDSVGPKDETPIGLAVQRAFSDSLVGNAVIASAPHPTRKSVLVELNSLFTSDIAHVSYQLEQAFRQSYALDARNSSIEKIRITDDQLTIATKLHFGLARLAVPTPGAPPGAPVPSIPSLLPDVRSLFMGVQYNIAKLPSVVMVPRAADARIGYFSTSQWDYSDASQRVPQVRHVNRWRLEKKDEAATLSEPKQPIVFWLDKNIPEKYRASITEGVLEWNKAFEKIGFKNAVVVKQQTTTDDFDTSDLRHASIRWLIGRDVPFGARGPSITDPRSGEILDADIEISDSQTRALTARYREDTPRPVASSADYAAAPRSFLSKSAHLADGHVCDYAHQKIDDMIFSLELLEARGEMVIGSPENDAFIAAGLKDLMAHEVGHTLGLRHNFRASTIYTEAQISDPAFTKANGLSGSVMDYNTINLGLPNQRQSEYFMSTLGPYDYWAIEYGYRPIAPAQEKEVLAKIAGRSAEPLLAYDTDEDAGFPGVDGVDPDINRGDLTNDPLAHYRKRVKLVRELWDKLQTRQLPAGTSYEQLRRNFDRGFANLNSIADLSAKYVGGVRLLRDYSGTGRLPITPVPVKQQREALNLIAENLFSESNFVFAPGFLNRLAIDYLNRESQIFSGGGGMISGVSLSLPERILAMQRTVLSRLTSDAVARRLSDAEALSATGAAPLSVSELYATLTNKIWSELDSGQAVSSTRRNLQREHLRWMVTLLKRDGAAVPGDARGAARSQAKTLLAKLDNAKRKAKSSTDQRAHFDDSADQLRAALNALAMRSPA